MYDVIAIGEVLIDFAPVETSEGGYPVLAAKPGGAPANYLAALCAYGCKAAFLAKVGDDAFGHLLRATLQNAGIETKGIQVDAGAFTTLAFVTLDETGNRSFSFARKPGADTRLRPEEVDRRMIDEARVFHFGTLSLTDEPMRTTTKQCVTYAREAGKLITFDPNLRLSLWNSAAEAKTAMLCGLEFADIVKISDEEVAFLWDCSKEEGAQRLLSEYGVRLAMVTLGADGCYLANKNGAVQVPCPNVTPIDTTGAGDIFGGSAVSRLLRMNKAPDALCVRELEELAVFACAAASLSTQTYGGIPSIPSEAAVLTLIGK